MSRIISVGYEGRTIDDYITTLTRYNVTALADVRRNPTSRKPGFSKTKLAEALKQAGIKYYHYPALGIESAKRQNLRTSEDYNKLLAEYEQQLSPEHPDIMEILETLETNGNIALTCFERDQGKCHRSVVSKTIAELMRRNANRYTTIGIP